MCYPKPGPRCSAHAKTSLKQAASKYKSAPSDVTYAAFAKAQDDYDATPEGIKRLKKQVNKQPDNIAASTRLMNGMARREHALRELKMSHDYGDVSVDGSDKKWKAAAILEAAHTYGEECEQRAKDAGSSYALDTTELAPGGFTFAQRSSKLDGSQGQGIIVYANGTDIAAVAKEETKKRKRGGQTGWGLAEASLNSPYFLHTGHGDAYNEGYAKTLNEQGIKARVSSRPVSENVAEFQAVLESEHRYLDTTNDGSPDNLVRLEVLEEMTDKLKEVRRNHDLNDQERFAVAREFAQSKVDGSSGQNDTHRKAWSEMALALKWSADKSRNTTGLDAQRYL